MTPTIESLGLRALPPSERIRLANDLYDSVGGDEPGPQISDELKAELDRRIADDDANPDDVISWEELKVKLYRKYLP